MYEPVQVAKGVYWVGAVDWDKRNFHGFTYSTHRGTTYNAYLVVDEKITLVDTVHKAFFGEMLERIKAVVDPRKIEYVIANHVEVDHSGSLPSVTEIVPSSKIFCTSKGQEGLAKHYFGQWNFQVVKTGDRLSLGKRNLRFIAAPMLHWPDSMFTYLEEEALLMPNDAFGQHLATSSRFADEVDQDALMTEAAKYYANILWPFSRLVVSKVEELQRMGIPIKTIAPSHGVIWRKEPMQIVEAYLKWAKGEAPERVIVAYETMWESTGKMARAVVEGIRKEGVEARLFRIAVSDRGDIIKELLEARALVAGSSTVNNGLLPPAAPFFEDLRGLKPTGRLAAAFGSYGWSGGATKMLEQILSEAGMKIVHPAVEVKWVPDESDLDRCVEMGRKVASMVKTPAPG